MKIRSLSIAQYRSLRDYTLECHPDFPVTCMVGRNGLGKTNILEALYFFALTKPFRTNEYGELFPEEEESFALRLTTLKENGRQEEHAIFAQKQGRITKRRYLTSGVEHTPSEFLGACPMVLFEPEDISAFSDSPSYRRKYLNILLSQVDRVYVHHLQQYNGALKRRNMLLKEVRDGRAGEEELVYWDELLANHGAEVMWKRREYVEYMNSAMTDYYEKISGTHLPLEVRYHATLPFPEEKHVLAEELRLALWARRRQDIMTTHTTHGIHREDIEVFREKKPFLSFASRGEVRTLLLALKLLELYYMKQTGGETPILLLDDVFSELDLGRQERLLAVVNDVQTIITVTHLDGIVHPEEKMHIIMLEEELGEQRG